MTIEPMDRPSLRASIEAYAGDVAAAIAFFSRMPTGGGVSHAAEDHTRPLAEAVRALPVAALAIALPAAIAMWFVAALGLSPLVAATVGVATVAATTGALHEDGLADVADGFWGGRDKAHALEIMRDSRIGTYGTLAVVFAALLRVALLAEAIGAAGPLAAAGLLLATAAVSRTVLLYPWVALPPARRDGLAAHFGAPRLPVFRVAVLTGLAIALVLAGTVNLSGTLVGILAAAGAGSAVARLADRKIGGHTGDVLGATQQLAEIAFLGGVLIFLA